MSANTIPSQPASQSSHFPHQVFPIIYVHEDTVSKSKAVQLFLARNKFVLLILALSGIVGVERIWNLFDYAGIEVISEWRFEVVACLLLLLTAGLYLRLAQWDKQRRLRQQARLNQIQSLVCTPAPIGEEELLVDSNYKANGLQMAIDYFISRVPATLQDESANGYLPEDFIAPDAMVLSFDINENKAAHNKAEGHS